MPRRLLITGLGGFTGQHLANEAQAQGFEVFPLNADISNEHVVYASINEVRPTHVIHLAAISAVTHHDPLDFYRVNLLGTQNLLQSLARLDKKPSRILLTSSANVYGHVELGVLNESINPQPVNHYAISKLSMEFMAATFSSQLPLVIARPFNYTGLGHDHRFVIPKIVDHYLNKAATIELGNIDVEREYNDVRTVCQAYMALLEQGAIGETYNICSGRTVTIKQILSLMEEISGHRMEVKTNPNLIRINEIHRISGDPEKLNRCIGQLEWRSLEATLRWMFNAG